MRATVVFQDYLYAVVDINTIVEVIGFMPGDEVEINDTITLAYRKPHAAIGMIYSKTATHAKIYIPALGPCPFIPELQNPDVLACPEGTRLILWFYDDGQISVIEKFSSAVEHDLRCIQALCILNGTFTSVADYDIFNGGAPQ